MEFKVQNSRNQSPTATKGGVWSRNFYATRIFLRNVWSVSEIFFAENPNRPSHPVAPRDGLPAENSKFRNKMKSEYTKTKIMARTLAFPLPLLLVAAVLSLGVPLANGASSITVEKSAYKNVVIEIRDNVPVDNCQTILQNLEVSQSMMEAMQQVWQKPENQRNDCDKKRVHSF